MRQAHNFNNRFLKIITPAYLVSFLTQAKQSHDGTLHVDKSQ
ncbi:hypothetical protein PPEP_a2765 [Pseudoalteromonas peptidolytica F12-50-A1]|uniref:Uncharacterized protein n=1 Tax=Pseudoalteromonas peptidolytica F12-50-A1 TaxID=1315280 RepID=A0A8I0MVP5_9GAMM|nr:hypothetical protein [Pseudoalteromonas peptidolytica F12-50-A1]